MGKEDGLLKSVILDKKGKKMTFRNGPVFVNGKMQLSSIKSFAEGQNQIIEVSYKDGKKVVWKLNPNGILELNYEYSLSGDYQFAGVSFDYPENYVSAQNGWAKVRITFGKTELRDKLTMFGKI